MNNRERKNITIVLLILFLMLPTLVFANEDSSSENNTETEEYNVDEQNSILDDGDTSNTNIKVSWKLKDGGNIYLSWNKIDNAYYYKIFRTDDKGNLLETTFSQNNYYEFKNLDITKSYKFLIKAYKIESENYIIIDKSIITDKIKPVSILPFTSYKSISNKTISKPKKLNINLREMLNESTSGYSTVQGACTDGNFIYYLLISKSNDKGKILKVNKDTLLPVRKSGVLNIIHGNGMACNSKEKKLLIVGKDTRRNELSIVDSDTLKLVKYQNIDYSNETNISGAKVKSKNNKYYGVAAITYNKKYNVYFALLREKHNILILNNKYQLIGFIKTNINENYPGVYQAMDSDDEYLYLALSPYNKTQSGNIVLAINYEANNIISMINTKKDFISSSYTTSAPKVIKINKLYELENIYHLNNTFYVSEYKVVPVYHYVTYKIKYKVKWKKVKKKVKVKKIIKYKKVLVKENGRYIYKYKKIIKYKYKKKKVWKYKTKYKKKKVYEFYYNRRDGNVYKIGSL